MKIEIQYLRHFEFGIMQTLELEINPEILVSELKGMINSHMKIPPQYQQLFIHQYK